MDLSITTTDADGTRLVSVVGEVDVSNAGELRSAVDAALSEHPGRVAVDLSQVAYIDSTGIGVLVGASHHADEAGCDFEVTHPQPNVRRVLGLLGVEKELNVEG